MGKKKCYIITKKKKKKKKIQWVAKILIFKSYGIINFGALGIIINNISTLSIKNVNFNPYQCQ